MTPVHAPRSPTRSERAFDIAGVLLVAPLALLFGILTAIAIFLDSPGSVFYRSTRVGFRGKEFQMLKFRKMHKAAKGIPLTVAQDGRFTPVGEFLAMTKLDEVPQLWNVLRGEMRLVGPRPEVPGFVDQYAAAYEEILTVTPGITGPAAVEYASEHHLLSAQEDPMAFYSRHLMPKKIEIDRAYVRTHTLRGDALILVRTALVPFARITSRFAKGARAHRKHLVIATMVAVALILAFAANGATDF